MGTGTAVPDPDLTVCSTHRHSDRLSLWAAGREQVVRAHAAEAAKAQTPQSQSLMIHTVTAWYKLYSVGDLSTGISTVALISRRPRGRIRRLTLSVLDYLIRFFKGLLS